MTPDTPSSPPASAPERQDAAAAADRFGPRAARELGAMFDEVSPRYDLLNRVMSLGQDRAWRAAMWRGVPEEAHVVLDLCTGSGTSLPGLRRPGRQLLGVDVSMRMLSLAAERLGRSGWGPRLLCADGFHLPLRAGSIDAITIAFGIRNLRPLDDALRELARVLRAGGTLVVLEATAPASGPFAPLHDFYLRRIVPLAGRLSADPSAYLYLSRSIFGFGAGPEFERALSRAQFRVVGRRIFLMGATRLWRAEREAGGDQNVAPAAGGSVQFARQGPALRGIVPISAAPKDAEWRVWVGTQLALSLALTASLAYGLWVLAKSGDDLPLAGWQRGMAWVLTGGGLVMFALRSVLLMLRFRDPPGRP